MTRDTTKIRPRDMSPEALRRHKQGVSRRSSLAYYHRNKERINRDKSLKYRMGDRRDKALAYSKAYYQLNKDELCRKARKHYHNKKISELNTAADNNLW